MTITRPSPSIFSGVAWSVPAASGMPGMIGLRPGDLIQTAGYHSAGDGGGATYRVVAAGTGIVDGGECIDRPASGMQARAQFGPAPDPRQFGARVDGATDDRLALQRWIDYIGARAVAFTGLSGPMIICDLGGGVFGVAGTLNLSLPRGAILRNGTLVAVGAAWGGGASFMLAVSSAYSRIEDIKLFCARRCSGMYVNAGRVRPTRCEVYEYIGHGILVPDTAGPEVWINQCLIGELDLTFNPSAFADNANYVGTGIEIRKSDCKVSDTIVRWTRCCYRATAGMQDIYDCHFYNGGAAAVVRTNNQIIDWVAGPNGELTISSLYHDNGYSHFYNDRVNINNISVICDGADMTPRPILNFFCPTNNAPARCNIRGVEVREWTTGASLVDFVDYNGNSWAPNYAAVEAFLTDFVEANRQNFSLEFNSTAVMVSTEAHNDREFWMLSNGGLTRLGLADRNTDTAATPYIGSSGNDLVLGAPSGAIDARRPILTYAAASDPATTVNGAIYYNSTSHKLRVRANGVWVDLH